MTPFLVLTGVGLGALVVWHHFHSKATAIPQGWEPYYGAPAWPAMTPQVVPEVGLPVGFEQALNQYGVSASLLEPFTA